MDTYLMSVQELSELLYDEDSASQARSLRDRLRREAEQTVGEIEAFMMLTSLPEAGDLWKPHHAALILSAAVELRRRAYCAEEMGNQNDDFCDSFPPVVLAAARESMSQPNGWDHRVSQPEAP